MTSNTSGGSAARKRAISDSEIIAPVGLFGLARNTALVDGDTAASIASRSGRRLRSGTLITRLPA